MSLILVSSGGNNDQETYDWAKVITAVAEKLSLDERGLRCFLSLDDFGVEALPAILALPLSCDAVVMDAHPRSGSVEEKIKAVTVLAKAEIPVLILYGDRDEADAAAIVGENERVLRMRPDMLMQEDVLSGLAEWVGIRRAKRAAVDAAIETGQVRRLTRPGKRPLGKGPGEPH